MVMMKVTNIYKHEKTILVLNFSSGNSSQFGAGFKGGYSDFTASFAMNIGSSSSNWISVNNSISQEVTSLHVACVYISEFYIFNIRNIVLPEEWRRKIISVNPDDLTTLQQIMRELLKEYPTDFIVDSGPYGIGTWLRSETFCTSNSQFNSTKVKTAALKESHKDLKAALGVMTLSGANSNYSSSKSNSSELNKSLTFGSSTVQFKSLTSSAGNAGGNNASYTAFPSLTKKHQNSVNLMEIIANSGMEKQFSILAKLVEIEAAIPTIELPLDFQSKKILMIGRTGAGKSLLGNVLLGM